MSSDPSFFRRHRGKLIGAVVAIVVLAVGVPWLYINVIQDDPPEKLTVEDATDCSTSTTAAAAAATPIDGTWTIGSGSTAGYRVGETLIGQRNIAVGRTSGVTGTLEAAGTTVSSVSATVDMTTVSSDDGFRDGQFRNRIMSTSQFPTATFTLTSPIDLGSVPAECAKITAEAKGDLTVHGVTNPVTTTVTAVRQNGTFVVNATIPVQLDDYDIPDAKGGKAASVDRNGDIELLLVFTKAS